MRIKLIQIISVLFTMIFFGGIAAEASPDAIQLSKVFNKRKKQKCLKGKIDTLVIIRENVEFHLGPGDVKLYDFGVGKPSMMLYKGNGRFKYSPPNSVEQKQLSLLTGLEKINGEFKEAWFLFTIDFDVPIDTSFFKREKIREIEWKKVIRFQNSIVEHLGFNLLIRQIGEIMSGDIGEYFLVKFKLKDIGEMVYCEDPMSADSRRIYRYTENSGNKSADIIAGYSPDGLGARQRGYIPIDITHYDINAKIDKIGEIKGNCKIEFSPLRGGAQFIYFKWSEKNKVISIEDDKGKPVTWLGRKNEPGFGVWLNESMQIGQSYSLDIKYKGTPFLFEWDIYFADEKKSWYPRNIVYDRATYEIEIEPHSRYGLAHGGAVTPRSSGRLENLKKAVSNKSTKWFLEDPVDNVLFCFGKMRSYLEQPNKQYFLQMFVPGLNAWGIKLDQSIITSSRTEITFTMLDVEWFEESANETARILILINRILESEPNYISSVIEYPYNNSMGSYGLICLSSYLDGTKRRRSRFTRAHETSHQWWGQVVGVDDYRNEWIIEGLAEYFAFMTDYDPLEPESVPDSILSAWRDSILSVSDNMLPLTLGTRLTNSKYDHYNNLVITKSAYIFHMIRYMLYDFNRDSDRPFIKFVRELFENSKWKTISVVSLKKTLEKHIGMEMDWFFDQWIYGSKIPSYDFKFDFPLTSDSLYKVILKIKQENVPEEFKMLIPVKIEMVEDYSEVHKVWINKPETEIIISDLPYKPVKVIFNVNRSVLCEAK